MSCPFYHCCHTAEFIKVEMVDATIYPDIMHPNISKVIYI